MEWNITQGGVGGGKGMRERVWGKLKRITSTRKITQVGATSALTWPRWLDRYLWLRNIWLQTLLSSLSTTAWADCYMTLKSLEVSRISCLLYHLIQPLFSPSFVVCFSFSFEFFNIFLVFSLFYISIFISIFSPFHLLVCNILFISLWKKTYNLLPRIEILPIRCYYWSWDATTPGHKIPNTAPKRWFLIAMGRRKSRLLKLQQQTGTP